MMVKTISARTTLVRAGYLTGVAGAAFLLAQPAAAQETCTATDGDGYICDDPAANDTDQDDGVLDYVAAADGGYDNLDTKIEQLTPSDAEVQAAQDAVDAAQAANDTAVANNDAVQASLSDENLAAFGDVEAAAADADAADAAEAAAQGVANGAQTAFDAAADALVAANDDVNTAQAALGAAQDAVDQAEADFAMDDSAENLAALNAALAARGSAQTDLADAEADRAVAVDNANDASTILTDANAALADATAASDAADMALADAETALDTSLATNDAFVDAITAVGETADADGIQAVADAVAPTETTLASAVAAQEGQDDRVNTLIRAREVLTPAAENANPAIAAAAQAYLGDPRASETNAEVEIVAALVDHEDRITTNADNIAANTLAIADESAARIAADAALQTEITNLSGRITGIEGRLEQLDKRMASAAATSIALGGLAFLPNKDFNLAVSGGFYDGEQAIAASIGARVSESVAITAGVGTGFGSESEFGGRVGVIFGW